METLVIVAAVVAVVCFSLRQVAAAPDPSRVEAAFDWARQLCEHGTQIELLCGSGPSLNLGRDEHLLAILPGTQLMEGRAVRKYIAGSHGVSIRLAKGVSFRVGATAGHSESQQELRRIDTGMLILTNERLIFSGSVRTNEIPLGSLLEMEAYTDALKISRTRKAKPEFYVLDPSLRVQRGRGAGMPVRHDVLRMAIAQASTSNAALLPAQ